MLKDVGPYLEKVGCQLVLNPNLCQLVYRMQRSQVVQVRAGDGGGQKGRF